LFREIPLSQFFPEFPMISHFSITLYHFFLTLYQFVPVCTSLYQFFLVAYRYVPLRPYFDPARSPIRLTDFGFGIGFPLAALSRRRQRVGFNAIAWDTFGMALGRPMGRSKSSMFPGLGTVVRPSYPLPPRKQLPPLAVARVDERTKK